jgi:hydrogenase expression/formation protein HypC
MCLAIPSRIVSVDGLTAVVDVCGARREANLMLLPEDAVPGDFVLIHAGFAMQKLERDAAEQSLQFFSRLVDAGREVEVDGEMREVLQRGSIAWDHDPSTSSG